MAIYHLSAKVISRADGRSAVAAAAYRAAEELHDKRLNRSHDFTNKAGVIHSEILLPVGAPAHLADRATLWNAVEAGEKRSDGQLAREIEIALPRELTKAQAIELARDFVREQFVARGMVADFNVHWGRTAEGEDQPHAHVMLTMREVGPDGFGKKVRDWNRTELLVGWRERWAEMANERLAELDHDVRIDHRSNAAQGIALEPQNKIGPAGARREARGEDAERAAEHQAIARRNGEQIIADPSVLLTALTQQQSTFTRRDLARFVDRHTADADQFTAAMAQVEASPELVRLGTDGRGQERFTTRDMLATEQRMEQAAVTLAERQAHRVDPRRRLTPAGLGREQLAAYRHVTQMQDLSVVVGYAGTGKSTMLGEARAAWEAEGYQVRGAALSGIAAEQLEAGAGIASRTVHSLLFQWEQGRDALTSRDVLVVDEAGMIGSRQMERLLSDAQKAGAKVVLVGDPEQLQAIEAGAAFRAIAERVGAAEITEVRRQREAWQQAATRDLATGQTAAALTRYEQAGMVHEHATLHDAKVAMVAGWDAARRETPKARQIMLAYRRDDVRDLNLRARAVRQAAGELGADWRVATERGPRDFAAGDRVYFLRNERGLGVKNGTLGTIERIEGHVPGQGERLVVRLDDGRVIGFDVKDYAHLDHGYAATVHKSQGVTVDRAHVLATSHMDRHAAYVGLSRHRERVDLHWGADELGSRERLARALGRERLKDTSLDYGAATGKQPQPGIRAESAADSARAYAERRGLVPESEIVWREPVAPPNLPHRTQEEGAASADANDAAPRRRGMFDGLNLGSPGRGRNPAGGERFERMSGASSGQTPAPLSLGLPSDQLGAAVERYASAWVSMEQMRAERLPVLEGQRAALRDAGAALDAVRPGSVTDLGQAMRYDPQTRTAMSNESGPARAAALVAGIEREAKARSNPEVRAARYVASWKELETAHHEHDNWNEAPARTAIAGRMQRLSGVIGRDAQARAVLAAEPARFGLEPESLFMEVVQGRSLEQIEPKELSRTIERELGLGRGLDPELGHGRERDLGMEM